MHGHFAVGKILTVITRWPYNEVVVRGDSTVLTSGLVSV